MCYCSALCLDIYESPQAVMTIQNRSNHEHSEVTENFSSSGQKWIHHPPKSHPDFVVKGYYKKKDPMREGYFKVIPRRRTHGWKNAALSNGCRDPIGTNWSNHSLERRNIRLRG